MEPQVFGEPKEQRKPRKLSYAEMAARNSGPRKSTPGKVGVKGFSAPKVPDGTSDGSAVVGRSSRPLETEAKVVPPASVSEKCDVTSDNKFDEEKVDPLLRDLQTKVANRGPVDLKQEYMLTISLSEFQKVLDNKNEIISDLKNQNATLLKENLKNLKHEDDSSKDCKLDLTSEKDNGQKKLLQENLALKDELEKLKQELNIQKSLAEKETSVLYKELHKKDEVQMNTSRKVSELEAALSAEKTKAKEAEAFLAQKDQETSKLKTTLIQMQEDMRQQRRQWEEDKSRLLYEQTQTVSSMKSAVLDTQKVLKDEMQRWQKEKSCLLETITTLKDDLMKVEGERKTTVDNFVDRINNLGQQLDKLQNPPKKKSFKGRFLQIFKRSEQKSPQSDPC